MCNQLLTVTIEPSNDSIINGYVMFIPSRR